MNADQIKILLNEKFYDGAKNLIGFEINEGTGGAGGRRADAIAFYLWPSNDYKLIGFEIKVSRADWLNELKQPEKSLPIAQFCDEWYLVAPIGVLGIDELPKSWGYIQASKSGLRTKIRAPKRTPVEPDKPFMASLLRSLVAKYQDTSLINEWKEKQRDSMIEEFEARFKRETQKMFDDLMECKKVIKEFNDQTGLQMNKWNFGNIVHLANAIKDKTGREEYEKQISDRVKCLEAIIEGEKKTLDSLKNIELKTKETTC